MVNRTEEDHPERGMATQSHPRSVKTFGSNPMSPYTVLDIQQAERAAVTFMVFSLRLQNIKAPVPSVRGDREDSKWAYARVGLQGLLKDVPAFHFPSHT